MTEKTPYHPPKKWVWDKDSGGAFAKLNRPVAGATHEKALPRGRHPLQLYSLGTPNGQKVTILLEELLSMGYEGAEYDAHLINIRDGDQFGSEFVSINPNSKIPALVDHSGDKPIRIFESGAIMLYLADKFSALIPAEPASRTECLNWLFWQMGSAPYLGGGFGHFYVYAPEKIEYAINRYSMEVKRQLDVLDRHLADQLTCAVVNTASLTSLSGPGMGPYTPVRYITPQNSSTPAPIPMLGAGPGPWHRDRLSNEEE